MSLEMVQQQWHRMASARAVAQHVSQNLRLKVLKPWRLGASLTLCIIKTLIRAAIELTVQISDQLSLSVL